MLWFALAAGAGYAAARALLDSDNAAETLPEPLRDPARRAAARLQRARARVREAIAQAGDATAEAERELTADYLRRAGRGPNTPPPPG
jgi:hypothetical protein